MQQFAVLLKTSSSEIQRQLCHVRLRLKVNSFRANQGAAGKQSVAEIGQRGGQRISPS